MNIKLMESNTWQHESKIEIKEIIDNNNFPYIFGKKASRNNTIQWLLCESSDNQKNFFLKGVIDYTNFIKATLPEERLLYPLIAVIQSNAKSLKEEHEIAWEFIQYLIDNEPKQWLLDVPQDPNNYEWCLCFNEVQLFINISSSKHLKYKSCNLGKDICLVINPRQIFDVVTPLNKAKGIKIRQKIRERVEAYNGFPAPKELGFFGDKDNLEWKQYQLCEQGGLENTKCPLNIHSVKQGTEND